eukprot:CAMPEP_0182422358 /NCGR_PEP_ID=MMETSP1167-20130531/8027_1 /TAXON_ID=2988 /ORGANISM="Mallomonas Sp, Strain CCMP3275" /LENGTH=232 /DNA_ID=CAMNT_0024600357 /DNA_START=450 /DNA_END=1145 /DNA_ORIENTATION=+
MAELIEALQFIHSKHIVHRDLNPSNILITNKGHIKLADFGLAFQFSSCNGIFSDIIGDSSEFVGTAEYLSPEILDGGRATPASDLWALGCLLYLLCIGCSPFFSPIIEQDDSASTLISDLDAPIDEYATYQAIRSYCGTSKHNSLGPQPLHWPDNVDKCAKEMVLSLLKYHPQERLGAGDGGDASLRDHLFVCSMNWGGLHVEESPLPSDTLSILPVNEKWTDGNRMIFNIW